MRKARVTQSESFKDRRGRALLPERRNSGVSMTQLSSVGIFVHTQGLMWAGRPPSVWDTGHWGKGRGAWSILHDGLVPVAPPSGWTTVLQPQPDCRDSGTRQTPGTSCRCRAAGENHVKAELPQTAF